MKTGTKYLALLFVSILPYSIITESAAEDSTTLSVAKSFLEAAGSGNKEQLSNLMTDDFVWHNEGDKKNVPWIGTWKGKETVLNKFLPLFGAGLKVTRWKTEYSFANGDQAVFIGSMNATSNSTGKETGNMSWAVRVHVMGGKVKSWNWFENSFAVSTAQQSSKK